MLLKNTYPINWLIGIFGRQAKSARSTSKGFSSRREKDLAKTVFAEELYKRLHSVQFVYIPGVKKL